MKKQVKTNVGLVDAYLRIALGCTLTSLGVQKKSEWLTILGSLKIAEGMTRFCPILYLLGKTSCFTDEG